MRSSLLVWDEPYRNSGWYRQGNDAFRAEVESQLWYEMKKASMRVTVGVLGMKVCQK